MKQTTAALYFLLFLTTTAPAQDDHPPVQADGRTWVWCDSLAMYRPSGTGWQYDADRETWWRDKQAIQPVARKVGDTKLATTTWGNTVELVWDGHCWQLSNAQGWTYDPASNCYVRPLRMNNIGATDPNPPGQVFYGAYTPGGMAACVGGR